MPHSCVAQRNAQERLFDAYEHTRGKFRWLRLRLCLLALDNETFARLKKAHQTLGHLQDGEPWWIRDDEHWDKDGRTAFDVLHTCRPDDDCLQDT